jgi:hypothetical protein
MLEEMQQGVWVGSVMVSGVNCNGGCVWPWCVLPACSCVRHASPAPPICLPTSLLQVSPQMHAEVVAVAEVVHFKVLNLLLHQQALPQALGQLREHLGLWGPVPGEACEGGGTRHAASHYPLQWQQTSEAAGRISIGLPVDVRHGLGLC